MNEIRKGNFGQTTQVDVIDDLLCDVLREERGQNLST